MARQFNNVSLEYLERIASVPVTGPPFTMACWYNTGINNLGLVLMQIQDKDVEDNYHQLALLGATANDPVGAYSRKGDVVATTSTGFSTNTWEHACGVWAAANDRRVYKNGGSKGTNTGTSNDANIDSVSIGRAGDSTPLGYMSGAIARAAIWDIALSDAEVALLASPNTLPSEVQADHLVAYWEFLDDDDDEAGSYDLTAYNTPGWAAHISMAVGPSAGTVVAAASGGTVVLGSLALGPTAVSVVTASGGPGVVLGSVAVGPAAGTVVGATSAPVVVLGSIAVEPGAVGAIAVAAGGTVVLGSIAVGPYQAEAITTTDGPTVVLGSIVVDPAALTAVTSTALGMVVVARIRAILTITDAATTGLAAWDRSAISASANDSEITQLTAYDRSAVVGMSSDNEITILTLEDS